MKLSKVDSAVFFKTLILIPSARDRPSLNIEREKRESQKILNHTIPVKHKFLLNNFDTKLPH
ncbi:hypothetical protein D1614_18135 [Maribellus luteus]|uniref:Uncharacterized protein n=1 Tax=Maribellus luteus TaxID=2305463 RepID=A0A399SWQ5_9BACT|nr:hypothetical protein D1614_18135 [Maribellus luteus]